MATQGSTTVVEGEMSECEEQEIEILLRLWEHEGPIACTIVEDGQPNLNDHIFIMKSAFTASGSDEAFVKAFSALTHRRQLHRRVQLKEQLVMFTHQEPALRQVFKFSFWLA